MFELHQYVSVTLIVNRTYNLITRKEELTRQVKVIGIEDGYWLKKPQNIYHVLCEEYPFSIKVSEATLKNGCVIDLTGKVAKVLNDETGIKQ